LFVTAFSVLLFVGAEILLRAEAAAWPFELDPLPMPYLGPKDAALGWRMPPGKRSAQRPEGAEAGGPALPDRVPLAGGKNNSLGLKNREVGPKPANTCRILFLGD